MMRKEILILGLGNELMADEGFGVFIVRKIAQTWPKNADFSVREGATLGIELLEEFRKYNKIIVIDAVEANLKAGEIVRFNHTEVANFYSEVNYSVHQIDFIKALDLAKILLPKLPEIVIIGIQPKDVQIRIGLSKEIEEKTDAVLKLIRNEIQLTIQPID